MFLESSIRQRVVNVLRKKFTTIEEAENEYGMSVDAILDGNNVGGCETPARKLACPSMMFRQLMNLQPGQLKQLMIKGLEMLDHTNLADILLHAVSNLTNPKDIEPIALQMFSGVSEDDKVALLDKLFCNLAAQAGLKSNLNTFVSLSIEAMKKLQTAGKHNLVYKWPKCIVGDKGKPFMALDKMPFGLIEYQMEFFTATNVMQVCTITILNSFYSQNNCIYIYIE